MDYIQNNPNARGGSDSEINCWLTFVKPNSILALSQPPVENTTENYTRVIHSIRTYLYTQLFTQTRAKPLWLPSYLGQSPFLD
jgi:hypothetical protein